MRRKWQEETLLPGNNTQHQISRFYVLKQKDTLTLTITMARRQKYFCTGRNVLPGCVQCRSRAQKADVPTRLLICKFSVIIRNYAKRKAGVIDGSFFAKIAKSVTFLYKSFEALHQKFSKFLRNFHSKIRMARKKDYFLLKKS